MREYCALMERFRDREEIAFLRTGLICSTIANCNRDPERHPTPFTPQDFMPESFRREEEQPEMTNEEREQAWINEMRVLVAMTGGTDTTNG